jgi:hypothetical protein
LRLGSRLGSFSFGFVSLGFCSCFLDSLGSFLFFGFLSSFAGFVSATGTFVSPDSLSLNPDHSSSSSSADWAFRIELFGLPALAYSRESRISKAVAKVCLDDIGP